jgi:dTDP-4-amino-4,6-dideoxygalactose transaminase
MIPLSAPDITEAEISAVTSVLRTPMLSRGPKLEEFESSFARYLDADHAVAVSSGTAGLHLSLRALGVREGDEVIVPAFAFVAVANAVRYEGAVPVLVDIEPNTRNLDPRKVKEAISPRTRAILLVHTFGLPADLEEFLAVARSHRLLLIEDSCEALGAEYQGHKVGTLGDAGVFAFYPNKQMTTGEGGMVVTRNLEVAERLRRLRDHGRNPSEDWLSYSEVGFNYRLPELSCALGIEQLKRLTAMIERRAAIAARYSQLLGGLPNLVLPPLHLPGRKISWFGYVLELGVTCTQLQRDRIWNEMRSRGIECGRYFGPIHWQPAYRSIVIPKFPLTVSESLASRTLALPFFNRISTEQMEEVATTLRQLVKDSILDYS